MLTEEQYLALKRIRESFVPASGKPDDMTELLWQRNLIVIKRDWYTVERECETQ